MMLTYPELSRICRSFAMVLHSGIPLADGAYLLAREEEGALAELLKGLGKTLDAGAPLSEALARTGAFPEHLWAMVRVGETTGHLEPVLERLSDYYESRSAVKKQLLSALAYPGTVLLLMLLVIGVLLVKVLPVFEKVYGSLGRSMTGTAAGLLHTGKILEGCLPALFLLLAALGVCAAVLYFSPKLGQKLILVWQKHWGDRGIARKFNNAHFAQALALGLSGGLPPEDCLDLARQLQTCPKAAKRVEESREALKAGASLDMALEKGELLAPSQRRLLAMGIQSGNAERTMEKLAQTAMEEAWEALDQAISSVEPTLVLICSGLIGLILLSVLLPLADILSVLG